MSVDYKDYYKVLGIAKGATPDEISKAYKKLARKYHPDLNKEEGAEDRFKEIGEAYEVLKDPETRQRYDTLGANWKAGQGMPPGWENFAGGFGGGGFRPGQGGPAGGDFSDFFQMFFGGGHPGGHAQGFGGGRPRARRGEDLKTEITVTLREVYEGTRKELPLQRRAPSGAWEPNTYTVTIPPGTTDGKTLRLSGQGGFGAGGGPKGDLLLKVRVAPHDTFDVDGHDLSVDVLITPWEAALGARVEVETMEGVVRMKIPAGVKSGQRLRLKGRGLPRRKGERGNLYAVLQIVVPKELSERERELFEELAEVSAFRPRGEK